MKTLQNVCEQTKMKIFLCRKKWCNLWIPFFHNTYSPRTFWNHFVFPPIPHSSVPQGYDVYGCSLKEATQTTQNKRTKGRQEPEFSGIPIILTVFIVSVTAHTGIGYLWLNIPELIHYEIKFKEPTRQFYCSTLNILDMQKLSFWVEYREAFVNTFGNKTI